MAGMALLILILLLLSLQPEAMDSAAVAEHQQLWNASSPMNRWYGITCNTGCSKGTCWRGCHTGATGIQKNCDPYEGTIKRCTTKADPKGRECKKCKSADDCNFRFACCGPCEENKV